MLPKGLVVLLAEDNEVNQELAMAILNGAAATSCWRETAARPWRSGNARTSTSS